MIWEANRISERSEEHSSGITLLKIASQTRTVFLKNDQYWTQNVATATQHQLLVDTCAAPTAINSEASSSSSLLRNSVWVQDWIMCPQFSFKGGYGSECLLLSNSEKELTSHQRETLLKHRKLWKCRRAPTATKKTLPWPIRAEMVLWIKQWRHQLWW